MPKRQNGVVGGHFVQSECDSMLVILLMMPDVGCLDGNRLPERTCLMSILERARFLSEWRPPAHLPYMGLAALSIATRQDRRIWGVYSAWRQDRP